MSTQSTEPFNHLPLYQVAAARTALPTAQSLDYLIPGLVSEVGEVAGVLAKSIRDQWSETERNERMTQELGDVAWMLAMALREVGIYTVDVTRLHGVIAAGFNTVERVVLCMATLVGDVTEAYGTLEGDNVDLGEVRNSLTGLWRILEMCSDVVCGLPFSEVLEANLGKLADRADRGVIGGSGDHR